MSSSKLSARLTTIKARSADLTVTEVKVPDNYTDYLTTFKANSSARSDSANEWTIDLFPNMIPIICYILSVAQTQASLTDYRNHAKSSVPTIALYNVVLLYGYFLLNDMYVRPSPSSHARTWLQSTLRLEFAQFLLSLPVPDSLHTIFAQLSPTQTTRTSNVYVIPSAAAFSHDQYFGRFIPITFFTAIHDCTATMPGNSPRLAILKDLFSRDLYKIAQTTPSARSFICSIADIIGVTQDQSTATTFNYYESKFYQTFTSVFNPVLFRDFQRRSSLSTLSYSVPTYKTSHPNAYDLLFSFSAHNIRETKVIMQSISSILTGHVTMSKNLGQIISASNGINALAHGYSTYALPTWSSNPTMKHTDIDAMTQFTSVTDHDRAYDISFLTAPLSRPTASHTTTAVRYEATATPGTSVTVPTGHRIVPRSPYTRRHTSDTPTWPSLTSDIVSFNDEIDVTPRVLVLDVQAETTISAHLATLTGKIVETFEIDGTAIELPRADKSLGLQNCMFADSAIPFKYVLKQTKFYPRAAGSILPPLKRAKPVSSPRLPATSILHDRTKIMLPMFNQHTIDNLGVTNNFVGLTHRPNVDWNHYVLSMFSFRLVPGSDNSAALDEPPNVPYGRLHVFSPYTYTPYETDEEPIPDYSENRSYFLTNLRTIFGTDYNLVEVKHPYEALPIS